MFKKNIISAVLLSSTALSAVAESGYSGEVLLGMADQKISYFGESKSGDDTSFGIRGAFPLNDDFAVEVAYLNHGEIHDTYIDDYGDTINDKLSSSALNLGIKGILPLDNGVSLNGRIGFSFWDAEIKETDSAFPGEPLIFDDHGNDFYYGIGIQYDINSQMFVGAEYSVTKMDISIDYFSANFDVENMSISLGFKF